MHLRTRLSLGSLFAASAVLSTILAWHARPRPAPPPSAVVVAAEAPGPDPASATIARLDLDWLPAGYVREGQRTTELAPSVVHWVIDDIEPPAIEYRAGVIYASSTEAVDPRFADGNRAAQPQDLRVCGTASRWLRDSLREQLQGETLICDRNVCSYSGGIAYAPDGFIIFHRLTDTDDSVWALDAWIEVYRTDLPTEIVARNEAQVVRALRHQLSTSCAGEPDGYY